MKSQRPTPPVQPKKQNNNPPENGEKRFTRFFKHYRTKKIMDAWEYGYKAWPIGGKA